MRLPTLCLLLAALAWGPVDVAGGPKPRQAAIRKGLAFLGERLFRLPEMSGTPRKPWTMAISGLVFLMANPHGGKGRLERIRGYLEDYVERTAKRIRIPGNLPPRHGLASTRYTIQYTWTFAAAGLFFAELELRGMGGPRGRRTLKTVLAVLADAQQPNGGWGHGRINPDQQQASGLLGGYPATLVAATNCAAITIGILGTLPGFEAKAAISKARAYYRAARLENGSFPYDPSQRSSGFTKTNVGRTAGALYAMHCLGMARDRAFRGSADYLLKNLEWIPEGHGSPSLNMMHGALCCRMLGKQTWKRFLAICEDRLIAAQDKEGALDCICQQKAFGTTCDSRDPFEGSAAGALLRDGRRCYTTALDLFVLLLDRDNLFALKRRHPGPPITPR